MNISNPNQSVEMNHKTPPPLVAILNAIEEQTAELTKAAAKLNADRSFTLDGRLVGDIGEMLAAQYLELTLDEAQRRGHDGVTMIDGVEYQVQIKCRKATKMVNFSTVPELLVVRKAEHRALLEEGDELLKGTKYEWLRRHPDLRRSESAVFRLLHQLKFDSTFHAGICQHREGLHMFDIKAKPNLVESALLIGAHFKLRAAKKAARMKAGRRSC